jgi:murein DD-endopeptidase MepM/ murein hydrolase activator NlpD
MKKKKLTTRYRFSIIENTSHKVRFQFKASKLSAIIGGIICVLLLLAMLLAIIAYTPLKRLIPGYPSPEARRIAIKNAAKIEQMERQLSIWSMQMENIQRIHKGEKPLDIDSLLRDSTIFRRNSIDRIHSAEDSLLKEQFLKQEEFDISTIKSAKIEQIEGLLFFTPIKGVVTEQYNPTIGHPFVDIAAPHNSTVSAVLDGTIIYAGWSDDTGFNIQIQHSNDLISVYKHNTKLLKKSGDKVKAGTPIALVGDAGELSTGPHLHFELWHKGEPIDPSNYINF